MQEQSQMLPPNASHSFSAIPYVRWVFRAKLFARLRQRLGFVAAFWISAGLQTEIREGAENSGKEIFSHAMGQGLYPN
jgi:hypothetical protein